MRGSPPFRHLPLSWVFHRQGWHLGLLALLTGMAWVMAAPALGDGAWLGLADTAWFWATVAVVVVHQVLIVLVWRVQILRGLFTRWFGRADLRVWAALFLPLLAARPLLVLGSSVADAGSVPVPLAVAIPLGIALAVPAAWALYSTFRYFTVLRAVGGDHFRQRYREMPMVREGAFAWTDNAMYTLAFLALWAIALWARSRVGIALVFLQHAGVWVHYFCTERPDMRLLHGDDDA